MTIKDRIGGIVLVGVGLAGLTFLGLRNRKGVVDPPDDEPPIVECEDGFHFDPITETCVSDDTPPPDNCPDGFHLEGGKCVIDPPVPAPVIDLFTQSTGTVQAPGVIGYTVEPHLPRSTWIWDFGDGTPQIANQKIVNKEYSSEGTFNGFVEVLQEDGRVQRIDFLANILAPDVPPPGEDVITGFVQTKAQIFRGEAVGFSVALGLPLESLVWDFGDGSNRIFNQLSVDHNYPTVGTFNGFVEARASNGAIEKVPFTVLVTEAPAAIITLSILQGAQAGSVIEPGELVNFQGIAGGGTPPFVSYDWNFGDGTDRVILGNPFVDHVYQGEGNFTLTLEVTDSVGNTKKVSKLINVKSNPLQFGDVSIDINENPVGSQFEFGIIFSNNRFDIPATGSALIRVFDGSSQVYARTNQFQIQPLKTNSQSLAVRDNWRTGVPLVLSVEFNDVNGKLIMDAHLTFTLDNTEPPEPQIPAFGTIVTSNLQLSVVDNNTLRVGFVVKNTNNFPVELIMELDPFFINPDRTSLKLDIVNVPIDVPAGAEIPGSFDWNPLIVFDIGDPGTAVRAFLTAQDSKGSDVSNRDFEQINF